MFKMMQDKLLFSTESSVLEKRCLCCMQFSHRFSDCPKLHFVADKERIIKSDAYLSTACKRRPFLRKTKKFNGLKHFLINNSAAKKKSFIVLNVLSEPPPESSNYLDSSEEFEGQDMEEKKKAKDESNRSSLANSKQEQEDFDINKIATHTEKSFHSHRTLEPTKKPSLPTSIVFNSNKLFFDEAVSEFQDKGGEEKPDSNPVGAKLKLDVLYYFFEKVYNYKNYFPDFNIETIVKNQNRRKRIFRECNRDDGVFEKYKNLKSYSFYSNPFLETLLKEMKLKAKHQRTNIPLVPHISKEIPKKNLKRNGLRIPNLDSKINIAISPLRKTYFDIPKNDGLQKKSLQDLITLIKEKKEGKRKAKS